MTERLRGLIGGVRTLSLWLVAAAFAEESKTHAYNIEVHYP